MTSPRAKTKAELEQERAQLLESLGVTEEELEGRTLTEVIIEKQQEQAQEQAQEQQQPLQDITSSDSPYIREESTIPVQISQWIYAYSGREVDPKIIFIVDKDDFRVSYRFSGSEQTYSILLNPDGTLVTPPPHVHEYHYPVIDGLTARHLPRVCSCGQGEPKQETREL